MHSNESFLIVFFFFFVTYNIQITVLFTFGDSLRCDYLNSLRYCGQITHTVIKPVPLNRITVNTRD